MSNSDTIGRGAAAICQGTGGAAEVLRAACGPPGPLLGPSELGAVLASIANGCPFAKYPGPLPGCCFLFLGFEVWQKYALRVTLLRGAIHGERKKRLEPLQMLTFLLWNVYKKATFANCRKIINIFSLINGNINRSENKKYGFAGSTSVSIGYTLKGHHGTA